MKKILLSAAGWMLPAALLPLPALAIDVVPSITLGEIYTSNVNLAPSGQEESEWVTRMAPSVTVDYQGARLDWNLDYTLEALFYAKNSDRNEVYNQLNTSALVDLIGESLQLRANGSISQVNLSPTEPVSNSNVNTTGNRADATTWNVGPQWQHDLFGSSVIDGFATVGRVDYDDPSTQDIDTTSARLAIRSDDRIERRVTYDLSYEYDKLAYDITGDAIVKTTYLQMGYRFNPNWQVFGLYGLDSNFAVDTSLDQSRWEGGFEGTFTRDSFRVSAGHRYFGSTYGLNWDHVTSNGSIGLGYSESPSTSDLANLRQIPTDPTSTDPTVPPPDPDINRPGNPTRFILKRGDANVSWNLHRSTLSLSVFWENRTDQTVVTDTSPTNTNLNDETSYGTDLSFDWEVGSRTTAVLGANWRHREYNDLPQNVGDPVPATTDELYSLLAGLDYSLGLRTTLSFEAGYRNRQGATSNETGSDYDEVWASLQAVRTF